MQAAAAVDPQKNVEEIIHRTQGNDAPLLIFSIPNEITMLIFSFACRPSPIFRRNRRSGFNAKELSQYAREEGQQLTISQVCQAWRTISHAYPELWSSFHYYSKYSRQYFTARLHTYLERAQSNLMTLWVCFSTTEDVSAVFEMLRGANNSRWKKISLVFDRNYIREGEMGWVPPRQKNPQGADSAQRFSYDNLETLDVGCPDAYWQWMNSDINRIIGDVASTPRLAALRVDAGALILQPNRASLSVLQLHGWGHWSISWQTFLSIFSNFPNLATLIISGFVLIQGPAAAPNMPSQKTVAPTLQYLRISTSIIVQSLWLYLHAPRLKHLAIGQVQLSNWQFPWGDDIARDAGPPMFPSLEVLALVNCTPHLYNNLRCVASIAHATRTISQLVISRDYTDTAPNDFFQYEMMMQAHALRAFWPASTVAHVHTFYTAPTYGTQEYINYPRALRVMRWRKRVLGDGWTLCISRGFAQRWSADAPELWKVAVAQGLVEPVLQDEHALPGDADPCWTYEAGFAADW